MEEVESLSSILGSTASTGESAPAKTEVAPAPPAEEPKVETVAQTKAPEAETKAPARDESGRFTKAEAETKSEEVDGRTAALRAERQRRQQLEARLRELENQKPAEKVSIFDDEDKGISQRIAEASRPLREANFNMSMKLARLAYKDDFAKAETAFFDSAEQDQRLYDQLRHASDPGEFIMTVGTQIAELAPVGGDFVRYREKVTGELKSELTKRDEQITALTAEIEKLKKGQAALESIPRSLNKGTESAPRSRSDADDDDIRSIARFGSRAN